MSGPPAMAVAIPWYRKEDWERLLEIFEDSDELHGTFEEWRNDAGQLESRFRSEGLVVQRVYIDPETFAGWCRDNGLRVGASAHSRFASEFAYKTRDSSV